jgi:hypothetical protein
MRDLAYSDWFASVEYDHGLIAVGRVTTPVAQSVESLPESWGDGAS